jgi:hypothetical protein
MKNFKNLIYLFLLSVLITSCSTTYTNAKKLDFEDGKFTLNGELFNGVAVSMMTSHNRVRERGTFKDGKAIQMIEHSRDEGQFEEIELSDGVTTYMSDMIEYERTLKNETQYYADGSIRRSTELSCEDGTIMSCEKNGKEIEYDEEGNVEITRIYENGDLKKED